MDKSADSEISVALFVLGHKVILTFQSHMLEDLDKFLVRYQSWISHQTLAPKLRTLGY